MDKLHLREHEMANKPRMRIWTDKMEGYGQFEIVEFNDADTLVKLINKIRLCPVVLHHCEGYDDCKCKPIKDLSER